MSALSPASPRRRLRLIPHPGVGARSAAAALLAAFNPRRHLCRRVFGDCGGQWPRRRILLSTMHPGGRYRPQIAVPARQQPADPRRQAYPPLLEIPRPVALCVKGDAAYCRGPRWQWSGLFTPGAGNAEVLLLVGGRAVHRQWPGAGHRRSSPPGWPAGPGSRSGRHRRRPHHPARNAALARQIAEGRGTGDRPASSPRHRPLARNFPRRNRLIAGLAQGVLVVEGGAGNGSRPREAGHRHCGREVLRFPGSIHSASRAGCPGYATVQAIVETAGDILDGASAPREMPPQLQLNDAGW